MNFPFCASNVHYLAQLSYISTLTRVRFLRTEYTSASHLVSNMSNLSSWEEGKQTYTLT